MKIEIEVTDNNAFNRGWLLYVLGKDRPEPDIDADGAEGWDMGKQTGTPLAMVRKVFTRDDGPDARAPYIVRVPEMRKVVRIGE